MEETLNEQTDLLIEGVGSSLFIGFICTLVFGGALTTLIITLAERLC